MAEIIKTVYSLVWGAPALVLLIGAGIFISFKTRFIQIRKFPLALKEVLGGVFGKTDKSENSVTPFGAVCMALASTVGTGNIAGVAGAIALGGAGAVFWMWVSAVLGMGIKTAEIILAVYYRKKEKNGGYSGGPMYYIKYGLGKNREWLAKLYAVLGTFAVLGTGNIAQVNAAAGAVNSAAAVLKPDWALGKSEILNFLTGLAAALIGGIILIGGVKRIGKACERIVPLMALLFVGLSAGVVFMNFFRLPRVVLMIFKGALNPKAVTGGAVGSAFVCMQKGLSRGIFSNEAGLGTSAIAHSSACTSHPVKQGLYGIFEVFADTGVICTLTALVILLSGVPIEYGSSAGVSLTLSAFQAVFGSKVSLLLSVTLCFFAFSTVIGWGFYGLGCFEFLFGKRAGKFFLAVYSVFSIFGAVCDTGFVWQISEIANGLMIIPNLIAVILLCPVAVRLIKEYFCKPLIINKP